MATSMKRSWEEIATIGSEGEDVEGDLNQSEDKGDEGTLMNQSEDEEGDESEDEEGDEGSSDESEDDPPEGTFLESEDEDSKSFFRDAWDFDLKFDEETSRRYSDAQKALILEYHKQMRETEGFGVTCKPGFYMIGGVTPLSLKNRDSDAYKKVESCALYAIKRYNEIKNETIELDKLEMATCRLCGGFLVYITFTAINSKTYETKVIYHRSKPHSVGIFRLKKSPQV